MITGYISCLKSRQVCLDLRWLAVAVIIKVDICSLLSLSI